MKPNASKNRAGQLAIPSRFVYATFKSDCCVPVPALANPRRVDDFVEGVDQGIKEGRKAPAEV